MRGFGHERPRGESVEWYTPPEVFEALGLSFDLDPAAPAGGVPWVPAERSFSRADDGLSRPWAGRVWLNPPYGHGVGRWLDRLSRHGDGLALVFARTDTRWYQGVVRRATAICFIAGRLSFVQPDGGRAGTAGAPSALLAFGLPCALALSQSRLGQTLILPGEAPLSEGQDELDEHRSLRP
jgi:DNA N-6-adenine-methyltransferase (Dam)